MVINGTKIHWRIFACNFRRWFLKFCFHRNLIMMYSRLAKKNIWGKINHNTVRIILGTPLYSNNKYLFNLEIEFTTPECHLCLIGCRRSILGHPKNLYDTMLHLNEQTLRWNKWNEKYDPYGLVKRVLMKIDPSEDNAERFGLIKWNRIDDISQTWFDHDF